MVRCRICNRKLTSQESISVRIGPECLERAISESPTPELISLRSAFGGKAKIIRSEDNDMNLDLFQDTNN